MAELTFRLDRSLNDDLLSTHDEDQVGELPSSKSGKQLSNVLSLPETLRKRSSCMVDNLELGAPLGRGSYGKVYKGKPYCVLVDSAGLTLCWAPCRQVSYGKVHTGNQCYTASNTLSQIQLNTMQAAVLSTSTCSSHKTSMWNVSHFVVCL